MAPYSPMNTFPVFGLIGSVILRSPALMQNVVPFGYALIALWMLALRAIGIAPAGQVTDELVPGALVVDAVVVLAVVVLTVALLTVTMASAETLALPAKSRATADQLVCSRRRRSPCSMRC